MLSAAVRRGRLDRRAMGLKLGYSRIICLSSLPSPWGAHILDLYDIAAAPGGADAAEQTPLILAPMNFRHET